MSVSQTCICPVAHKMAIFAGGHDFRKMLGKQHTDEIIL